MISPKRINNLLIPLRAIFVHALHDGVIDKNPMERVKNLKVETREADPFSLEKIRKILDVAQGKMRSLI